MLAELQNLITDVYNVDCGYQVTDYLITDRTIADHIGRQPLRKGVEETVLVAESEDGVALSVYLDQALLSRLAGQGPLGDLMKRQFADLATVLEGISHFNYLVWSASQDRSVTLLELELQAEVDKFVVSLLLALKQQDHELARKLHCWLFDEVRFHPSLSRDQRERYATANDYAARFCHRMLDRIDCEAGLQQLRDFYRLTQPEKISHIHSLAWA